MPDLDLTTDHRALADDIAARRYFRKFARITRTMTNSLGTMADDSERTTLSPRDGEILGDYVGAIAATFQALSMKYLIAARLKSGARHLTIDFHESGFPVFQEIVTLASDAAQAATHLAGLAEATRLKDEMIKVIVGQRRIPQDLQYALSQRLYFERLARGGLFFAQMHPQVEWISELASGRHRFLLHWAIYDSQMNVPVVYLLECEDSGRKPLPKDAGRWPAVQSHLLAQSASALKLLTIAKGFDSDFADLHPKRLRRFFLGPMYSSAFTLQTGPIRSVLEDARSGEGDDWALAWTVEELVSGRVELEKGWFSTAESEIFVLDPIAGHGADGGATRILRNLILPERPFQVLAEMDPDGFRAVRKYVVGRDDKVMVYA
ncbi:MAG: hypothetical protein WBA91_04655 [Paracoccaceae bacterium]